MRRFAALAVAAAVAACSRDTSLPAPPGPGSIQGRVVYAVAGQSTRVAAAGARVTVLGTSVGATAGGDGRFVVSAPPSDGDLLVQVDLDGDGKPDRQTLLSLSALGARPGRDLALGDVVVVENARLHGRVLRADVASPTAGHAGTVVFVPQGPFTTLTGDDGSYVFENLPEGRLSLTFFKDGYAPAGVDGLQLGAGQDFTVRDVTLSPAPPPPGGGAPSPGAVAGQLTFSPAASGAGARVLATQLVPDPSFAASVAAAASGAFQLGALPPGLYQLEASRPGYATAVVSNVMVGAGATVQLAISLAAQGVSVDPVQVGTAPSCVAGVRCELPDPCHVGAVDCTTGAPVCIPVSNALNGTACGVNHVCSDGSCVSVCIGGASCTPSTPALACMQGVIACDPSTGSPSCVAGALPLANGTSCGANQVCSGGTCTTCTANVACAPANPCDSGLTDCSSGAQTCRDTGLPVADGVSCGTNLFCAAGVCGACQPGVACTPLGFPCHTGTTSCATGRSACVDAGTVVTDGASCGTDLVCRSGACLACAAGASCTPQNPCHTGLVACGTGLPVCVDQQANVGPGVACGADRVCDGAGTCVSCVQGQSCTPANRCVAGGIQCATGAPVCAALPGPVNLANGTTCGTDQVCSSGTCTPCVAGASCTPQNPCHSGATSCATGASVCGDTTVKLADGAACGTSQVCSGGSCVACATGAACDGATGHASPLASPDPCKTYGTVCATGTPACAVLASAPDGTGCPGGTGYVCRAGTCTAPGYAIRLALNGLGAQQLPDGTTLAPGHAYPDGSFVVTVQVVDVSGTPVLTPQTVTAAAPPGAIVSPASASSSASDGTARFTVTGTPSAGAPAFAFSAATAFTPLQLTVQIDAPPDGMLVPVLNAGHVKTTPSGGPAAGAHANDPAGVLVGADGTVYYNDWLGCQLWKITPAGVAQLVAGSSCGYRDGPAASALLGSGGIAFLDERDPANPAIYMPEYYNQRVRRIWLSTLTVETFAGDGATSGADGIGDGNPPLSAHLAYPNGLALGPDGAFYVSDTGHNAVRRIDPAPGGIVTTFLSAGASCSGPLVLSSLAVVSWDGAGSLAFDEKGSLFLSGRFCGGELGTSPVPAVVRVNADRSLSLVAGWTAGTIADGAFARAVAFPDAPILLFDHAADAGGVVHSNLYLMVNNTAFLRVEPSGRIAIVAGAPGVTGASADFVPATAARFNGINGFAFRGRDLVFSDEPYGALRAVTGVARATATAASLSAGSATSVPAYVDQNVGALVVRLSDAAGTPLAGFRIRFDLDPGALAGGWTSAAAALTDSSGYASVSARAGLAAGGYGVLASLTDLHGDPVGGSPVAFRIAAGAPPAGSVFTVVNGSHVSATAGAGGPAVAAQIPASFGVGLLPDGSLAFASNLAVWRVDASGLLSVLAGTPGAAGFAGDGGLATNARFSNWAGMAIDRARGTLYVSDNGNQRIRAVDLATGLISTFAGTGASSSTGDGGPAASATLAWPERIHVLGGWLYEREYGSDRIRRIGLDPAAPATYGLIFPYLQVGASTAGQTTSLSSCTAAAPFQFRGSGGSGVLGGSMAIDPSGAVYLSSYFCGGPMGTTTDWAIARVDPASGNLQLIAGQPFGATPAAGQALSITRLPGDPTIQFDAAGRLWVATRSGTGASSYLGWIAPDATTGHVESSGTWTPVGTNALPSTVPQPEDVPAAGYWFGGVFDLAFDANGHLFFTDSGDVAGYQSNAIRAVW